MCRSYLLSFLVLNLALLGCENNEYSALSGKVTFQGKPLTVGTVSFKHKTAGTTGYGNLQSDGSYSVKTGRNAGLLRGEYAVYVVATEIIPSDGNSAPNVKLLIPSHYAEPETSGLNCTVPAASDTYDIILEK